MIRRTHYLDLIQPFIESDQIKIIVGIRRCGKSVVLSQIQDEIRPASTNIIYLDFELESVSSQIKDGHDLVQYVHSNRKEGKCYIFLDELQDLKDWNIAVRSLRLENTSIFITGSNSKMLSGEYASQLGGRYITIQLRPFVYQELEQYAKELNQEISIHDYLMYGGFPMLLTLPNETARSFYMNDLFSTIVLNDIIVRHGIKKPELFQRIAKYVILSNARLFSAKSIADYIKNERITCSVNTIQTYIRYLKEAFIISSIDQYDAKIKRNLLYYEKLYDTDVGFNTMLRQNRDMDLTHNFENAIYNELLFKGYSLSVFRYGDYEIDFLASKNHVDYLIQAAYSIAENSTREREFRPFDLTDNSMRKIMISNDDFDLSTGTVKHIKFKDFLELDDLNDAF
jgi:predicted AAA+ superfamily ATPase